MPKLFAAPRVFLVQNWGGAEDLITSLSYYVTETTDPGCIITSSPPPIGGHYRISISVYDMVAYGDEVSNFEVGVISFDFMQVRLPRDVWSVTIKVEGYGDWDSLFSRAYSGIIARAQSWVSGTLEEELGGTASTSVKDPTSTIIELLKGKALFQAWPLITQNKPSPGLEHAQSADVKPSSGKHKFYKREYKKAWEVLEASGALSQITSWDDLRLHECFEQALDVCMRDLQAQNGWADTTRGLERPKKRDEFNKSMKGALESHNRQLANKTNN